MDERIERILKDHRVAGLVETFSEYPNAWDGVDLAIPGGPQIVRLHPDDTELWLLRINAGNVSWEIAFRDAPEYVVAGVVYSALMDARADAWDAKMAADDQRPAR